MNIGRILQEWVNDRNTGLHHQGLVNGEISSPVLAPTGSKKLDHFKQKKEKKNNSI